MKTSVPKISFSSPVLIYWYGKFLEVKFSLNKKVHEKGNFN